MLKTSTLFSFGLLFLLGLTKPARGEGICFMYFQMSDAAHIEPDLVHDVEELINSTGVKDLTLNTWVYIDGRNFDGTDQSWKDPIQGLWTEDGSMLVAEVNQTKFEGTRYLHYDHDLSKMVVERKFVEELNSDDPQVMYDFFSTAMADCVAQDASEYFALLSNHGGGYLGFGGDQNPEGEVGPQTNSAIANTLKQVLMDVKGAPEMYDVLGFDACLMSAVGALDDYASITKYYLASEAEEPGHGFNYETMTDTSSALAMATEFVDTYANTMQGDHHRVQKTLAVIDTTGFATFKDKFDAFMLELADILEAGNDANLYAHLHRARHWATTFSAIGDSLGQKYTSGVDIGNFLETFAEFCDPNPQLPLAGALQNVTEAYAEQFYYFATGPGTKSGATGMHVMWPIKQQVTEYPDYWYGQVKAYGEATNFTMDEFLVQYLKADFPGIEEIGPYCMKVGVSEVEPQHEGQLLLNPSFTETAHSVFAQSDIALSTTSVRVEYGVDLTNQFVSEVEEDDSYFIMFGGNAPGLYCGPTYTAQWDRYIYSIADFSTDESIASTVTQVYVKNEGPLSREIPVVIFDGLSEEVVDNGGLFLMTPREAIDTHGGYLGYLTFSLDNETLTPLDGLALFGYVDSRLVDLSNFERQIAPINHILASFNDTIYTQIVAGLKGKSVMTWLPKSNITVFSEKFDNSSEDRVLLEMVATEEITEEKDLNDPVLYEVGIDVDAYPPTGPTCPAEDASIAVLRKSGSTTNVGAKQPQEAPPSTEALFESMVVGSSGARWDFSLTGLIAVMMTVSVAF